MGIRRLRRQVGVKHLLRVSSYATDGAMSVLHGNWQFTAKYLGRGLAGRATRSINLYSERRLLGPRRWILVVGQTGMRVSVQLSNNEPSRITASRVSECIRQRAHRDQIGDDIIAQPPWFPRAAELTYNGQALFCDVTCRITLEPYRKCPGRRGQIGLLGHDAGAVSIRAFEVSRWCGGHHTSPYGF